MYKTVNIIGVVSQSHSYYNMKNNIYDEMKHVIHISEKLENTPMNNSSKQKKFFFFSKNETNK